MLDMSAIMLVILAEFASCSPMYYDYDNFIKGSRRTDLSSLGKEWNEGNPEELGEYAQGDIVFPKKIGKNGVVGESLRWGNGIVPYEISGHYSTNDLNTITRAINIYKKYTCVSLRPRLTTDTDYISIANGATGCWSSVGRIRGRQEINLQSPYCTSKVGTVLHELMHAIGFLHEQNRYERDDYVTVAWQNIKRGHENNFDKAKKGSVEGFGVPYDFRSVMHYSSKAFSSNGKDTIIPKDASKVEKMGQRDGFSKGDITKINAMYNCPEKTATLPVPGGNNKTGNNSSDNEGSNNNPLLAAASFLASLFTE